MVTPTPAHTHTHLAYCTDRKKDEIIHRWVCDQQWFGGCGLWCAFLSDYDERSTELDDTPCLHNSVLHHELRY